MTSAVILAVLATSWADAATTIYLTDTQERPYDGVVVKVIDKIVDPEFILPTKALGQGRYDVVGIPQVEQVFVRVYFRQDPPDVGHSQPVLRSKFKLWPPPEVPVTVLRGELAVLVPPQESWVSAARCRYAGVETTAYAADGSPRNRRARWEVSSGSRIVSEVRVLAPQFYAIPGQNLQPIFFDPVTCCYCPCP